MADYTAGPWLADFHNEQRAGGRFITYVRGGNQLVPIAAVPTGVEGYGREEGRANAALIALAPELIEALEEMPGRFEEASNNPCTCATDEIGCPYCNAWERVTSDVNALLARAKP